TNKSWYVGTDGHEQEVGDLCRPDGHGVYGPRDGATGADVILHGHPYLIQGEWSNSEGRCSLGAGTEIGMRTNGHVGPLILGSSTASDVTALMGSTDATANGQISGYPPYLALGYQCGLSRRAVALVWDGNPPYCKTAFFTNTQTNRLEAVASQSDR